MAPPKKNLDTPELNRVKAARAALVAHREDEKPLIEEWNKAVVAALQDHGLPTLATVAEVSTNAIRDIRDKKQAKAA